MMSKIDIITIIPFFLLFCCGQKRSESVFPLLSELVTEDSLTFIPVSSSDSFMKNGMEFTLIELKISQLDSLSGYWGIRNDTIYFVSSLFDLNDKCARMISMFAFSMERGDFFTVKGGFCNTEGKGKLRKLVVRLLDKYEIAKGEVYVFEHQCGGFVSSDVDYPDEVSLKNLLEDQVNRRVFHVMKDYGIIKYHGGEFNEELQYNNCPYYPYGPKIPPTGAEVISF